MAIHMGVHVAIHVDIHVDIHMEIHLRGEQVWCCHIRLGYITRGVYSAARIAGGGGGLLN